MKGRFWAPSYTLCIPAARLKVNTLPSLSTGLCASSSQATAHWGPHHRFKVFLPVYFLITDKHNNNSNQIDQIPKKGYSTGHGL